MYGLGAAAVAIVVLTSAPPVTPPPIGGSDALIGNTGSELIAYGTRTNPGSGGTSHHSGTAHRGSSGTSPAMRVEVAPRPQPPTPPLARMCAEWTSLNECIRVTPVPADPATPTQPGASAATPSFTIHDLASFSPAKATLSGEPDNLGVAGLPTNFTASAATHTRDGELFGYPLTARFTPKSFIFHYGDSSERSTTTPGRTWDDLNLPQFAPTDTSHTYSKRGTYQARVDTLYTAEINLGTGWIRIAGTLTIPGSTQEIRIYEAHTALVAHTCTENPTAAGC